MAETQKQSIQHEAFSKWWNKIGEIETKWNEMFVTKILYVLF